MSLDSLEKAKATIAQNNITNVEFIHTDIFDMPFENESFDHVFICFILEHVEDPVKLLKKLKDVLKPNGTITIIEGDHDSCFWYPESKESKIVWDCLVRTQSELGHNALIGRQLYHLLVKADFEVNEVTPKWVYSNASQLELLDMGVNKIMVPMVETSKERSIESGLMILVMLVKIRKDHCSIHGSKG